MVEQAKKENHGFLGKRIEDENGRLLGWRDEFGDMHTPRGVVQEISCGLILLVSIAGLIAGCSMRVHEEIQKRREKNINKPIVEKADSALLMMQQSERRK